MKKTDEWRLSRIVQVGEQLANVIEADGITEQDILSDLHTQWLVTTPLYNIGEQAYGVSKEFKQAHLDIPWSAIAGMRHRLVHDYEGTNWRYVAEAVLVEVPELVQSVRDLLETMADDSSAE